MKTRVITSFYQDSVILMRVAAQARTLAGVREVAMFMGTPANHALLEHAGLGTDEGRKAGPNDLIMTVDAECDAAAAAAIDAAANMLLETRKTRQGAAYRPRTIESALRSLPAANLVSLSIPGPYVKAEALSALKRDLHLFIFSDNVPIEDEIEIKREAVRRRRLCMGPDQGTAYLGGVGLGFANVVARGRVGCVAASGTGLQAVVARLDALGEGISHGIGVGGRDLSEAVGGMMTLQALDALALDDGTQVVVVISKPPHPAVLLRIEEKLAHIGKPSVLCCVGTPARTADPALRVPTLDQAADAAVALLAGRAWQPARFSDADGVERQRVRLQSELAGASQRILGLYTGGTLAYEAGHLLAEALGENHGHRILDLGDDAYTVGRPHPMIDPKTRTDMIVRAATDPQVGVLLLDLVLGHGAHLNPAEPLAAAVRQGRRIAARNGRRLACLAAVLGTAGDPQGLATQKAQLEDAGIAVFSNHADAVRCAAMLTEPRLHSQWPSQGSP